VFSGFIDVWNAKTFDCELSATLAEEADLVRNYMTTEHRIFLAHDLGRALERSVVRPDNPYASSFHAFEEAIGELMRSRVMRAWHYTRLTEAEVDRLWHEGIHLSTPETLRSRFDLLVASGEVSAHLADALYAASPFHGEQLEARINKFWMVSHPVVIHDRGVEPLMAHWGGEVASFCTKDPVLLSPIAAVGQPRVIELTVPLALTRHNGSAGKAAVATFGRTLGCIVGKHFFDLCATTPLRPDSVLRVHSEGDSSFQAMGTRLPRRLR
jgi:hypothetical protein